MKKRWRRIQAVFRHRSARLILMWYSACLGGIILILMASIVLLRPGDSRTRSVPAVADNGIHPIPFQLTDDPNAQSAKPPRLTPAELELKTNLAETEFSLKHFTEAEQGYREILVSTPRKPLAVYHIFTCMLLQGSREEADCYIAGIPQLENSPALFYAEATRAFLDGEASKAQEKLNIARSLFPDLCPFYDQTLQKLGYLP